MKKSLRKNNRKRQGFTLVELLAVIAIVGILAGFGFVAVIQHQRNLKLTEMDNTAREIFIAAQNHLTESKSTGEWERLYQEYKEESSFLGKAFSQSSESDSSEDHDWRTITVSPATINDLRKDDNSAIGIMLPEGATDETILTGGCYVIRYDAKTASVYSVYYTPASSTDENLNEKVTAIEAAPDNIEEDRSSYKSGAFKYPIGYYQGEPATDVSSDTASTNTSVEVSYELPENDKPDLKLVNGERLLLVVDDSKLRSSLNTQQLVYSTKKLSADDIEYDYSLTLEVYDSHGNHATIGDGSGETVKVSAITPTEGDYSGKTVYILDSVAEGDADHHFSELFPKLTAGSNIYVKATATVTWNQGTQENTSTYTSNICNSLFDDTSEESSGIARISNGRHLQNLSTGISGVSSYRTAELTNDIYWGTANTGFQAVIKNQSDSLGITSTTAFHSIYNSNLSVFQSKQESETATTVYTLHDFTITQETLGEDDDTDNGAGLFRTATSAFTIQNVNLSNFSVTADSKSDQSSAGYAGALLGSFHPDGLAPTLTIKNVTISDTTVGKEFTTSSGASAGSGIFVGAVRSGTLNFDSCKTIGKITVNGNNAGGLVGQIRVTSADIQNCQVGTDADSVKIHGVESAGGFIGAHYSGILQISKSNVVAETLTVTAGTDADDDKSKEGMAGGMIGKAKPTQGDAKIYNTIASLTVSSSNITVTGDAEIKGARHAGGVIGQYNLSNNNLTGDIKPTFTIKDTNIKAGKLNVTAGGNTQQATYCAGGFIGEVKDSVSGNISNCNIDSTTLDVSIGCKNSVEEESVGGFIGELYLSTSKKSAPSLTFENNNIYISTTANIITTEKGTTAYGGGFIGEVLNNYKDGNSSVTFTKCKIIPAGKDSYASDSSKKAGTINITAGTSAGGFIGTGISAGTNSGQKLNFSECGFDGGASGLVLSLSADAGGFFGKVNNLTITFSDDYSSTYVKSTGDASDTNHGVGGFGGYASSESIKINDCYAGGRTNDESQGQGKDYSGEPYDRNVYAAGKKANVGGFIGNASDASIENCYTTCSVRDDGNSTESYAGGFVGVNSEAGSIKSSYCTGLVTASGCTAGAFSGNVNSTSQGNYYLDGLYGNLTIADGKQADSATKSELGKDPFNNGTVTAEPYSDLLANAAKYPFAFTSQKLTKHIGDWPSSVIKNDVTFKGDFSILYYEIVQHGEDKNARDYYYHGYTGGTNVDGTSVALEEIQTEATNAEAIIGRPNNGHGLLTGHGEYVVEEGYIILLNTDHIDLQNNTVNVKIFDQTFSLSNPGDNAYKYDAFLDGAGINKNHYVAYVIDSDKFVSNSTKATTINLSLKTGNTEKEMAQFYIQPCFSDTLSQNNSGMHTGSDSGTYYADYKIRSAKQMKLMFENGGNSGTDIIEHADATLTQSLDITFDKNKVAFTEVDSSGKSVAASDTAYQSPKCGKNLKTTFSSLSPTLTTVSAYKGENPDRVYVLDGLNNPLFTSEVQGTITKIYVQNSNADYFINNIANYTTANLTDCDFVGNSFKDGIIKQNNGAIDSVRVNGCENTSCFVNTNTNANESSIIKNVTIKNSTFTDAVISENQGIFKGKTQWDENVPSNNYCIENVTAPYFIKTSTSEKALISNTAINNCTFTDSVINSNNTNAKINTFALYNSTASSSLIKENKSSVENITVDNCTFGGSIISTNSDSTAEISGGEITTVTAVSFVGENTNNVPKIDGVSIENSRFLGSGGFVITNSAGSITNCSLKYCTTDYSGFANSNSAEISNCYIVDSMMCTIGGNGGFVQTNQGTIKNCQVYSSDNGADETSVYEDYLKKYTDQQKQYYLPKAFSMSSDGSVTAEEKDDLQGYELVTVGMRTSNNQDYSVATTEIGGFVYENSKDKNIINCSFTGSVYGLSSGGFSYTNNGNEEYCYANALVYGTNSASGFSDGHTKDGKLNKCHALGTITAQNGYGFIRDNESENVEDCYTAVWSENCAESYSPFMMNESKEPKNPASNYVMTDIQHYDITTLDTEHKYTCVTDEQLRNSSISTLGDPVEDNTDKDIYTVPYHQFTVAGDDTYPYPMPSYKENNVSATLKAYGDWRPVNGVFVTPDSAELSIGEKLQLTLEVVPENTSNVVTWSITDTDGENVATLSDSGLLTGCSVGTAEVTVTVTNGETTIGTAKINVRVYDKPSKIIISKFDGNDVDLTQGPLEITYVNEEDSSEDTRAFTAKVTPDSANQKVKWYSSDPEVISIDSNGVITTKATGTATITAKTWDESLSSSIEVTVVKPLPNSVKITDANGNEVKELSIKIGDTDKVQLLAAVEPSGADSEVEWSFDPENIATRDNEGYITGVAAGKTTLTVTTKNGKKASCEITVSDKVLNIYKDNQMVTSVDLNAGSSVQLSAGFDTNDSPVNCTWSCDDSFITIENGKITASADAGGKTTTVHAKYDKYEASCTIQIENVADTSCVTIKSTNHWDDGNDCYRTLETNVNNNTGSSVNYITVTLKSNEDVDIKDVTSDNSQIAFYEIDKENHTVTVTFVTGNDIAANGNIKRTFTIHSSGHTSGYTVQSVSQTENNVYFTGANSWTDNDVKYWSMTPRIINTTGGEIDTVTLNFTTQSDITSVSGSSNNVAGYTIDNENHKVSVTLVTKGIIPANGTIDCGSFTLSSSGSNGLMLDSVSEIYSGIYYSQVNKWDNDKSWSFDARIINDTGDPINYVSLVYKTTGNVKYVVGNNNNIASYSVDNDNHTVSVVLTTNGTVAANETLSASITMYSEEAVSYELQSISKLNSNIYYSNTSVWNAACNWSMTIHAINNTSSIASKVQLIFETNGNVTDVGNNNNGTGSVSRTIDNENKTVTVEFTPNSPIASGGSTDISLWMSSSSATGYTLKSVEFIP